ncbi:MAG TPA: efflux RND transporter permease subunit, partial [Planctomycetota bacterium]|nr:efflux RND transporter permease subunit [Planctomycetota bacterium]
VGIALALAVLLGGLAGRVVALVCWPLSKAFELAWGLLERVYPKVVRLAVTAPVVVLGLAALLVWDAARRVPRLGVELLPEIHQGEFTAFVQLDVGNPLPATDAVLSALDAEVRRYPEVRTTALTVGVEQDTLSRDVEGPNTARLTVRMAPEARDAATEEALSERVRRLAAAQPATDSVEIRRPTPFALASPIAVEVRGHDLEALDEVAARVYHELERLDAVADLRSSQRPGHPELRITFDRDALLEYALDLGAVATLVRNQVLGDVSTRFARGDERIDVRVMADEELLSTQGDLLALVVNPGAERPVPLSAIADVRVVRGPAEIRRVGNSRAIVLEATSRGLDLGGTSDSIEAALATLSVPDDVAVVLGGQKREMDEAQQSMRFALLLAVFLVYVVMAAQFESLVQPFVILLTVPLAGVGVVYALDALGIPLSVVVFIGLILLAGIVVNNAIVLVDRINQNRTRGLSLDDAIVEAGRARLRPILMTTTTTLLGLLPMTGWLAGVPVIGALGAGEGAEIRAPMAIAVITGLLSSTLLTLVVIPSVYRVVAGLERRERAARRAHAS